MDGDIDERDFKFINIKFRKNRSRNYFIFMFLFGKYYLGSMEKHFA